jgi:hypothetical protein
MEGYEEPIADASWLKKNLEYLRKYFYKGGNAKESRKLLFTSMLCGYYDCMWGGLQRDIGHVIYRLSDLLSEDERRQMKIYPSSDGSILVEEGDRWDSLEDWRKLWEKSHPIIPEFDFQKHLEATQILGLPETAGRTQ